MEYTSQYKVAMMAKTYNYKIYDHISKSSLSKYFTPIIPYLYNVNIFDMEDKEDGHYSALQLVRELPKLKVKDSCLLMDNKGLLAKIVIDNLRSFKCKMSQLYLTKQAPFFYIIFATKRQSLPKVYEQQLLDDLKILKSLVKDIEYDSPNIYLESDNNFVPLTYY